MCCYDISAVDGESSTVGDDTAASSAAPPPAKKPKTNNEAASSFTFGEVSVNKQNNTVAKPASVAVAPAVPRRLTKKDDDNAFEDGLPVEIQYTKNGETPFGRIRSCMCRNPSACREVMWRWARLKEAKYINYLQLPSSKKAHTDVGKHVTAYREAVLRHLGYDTDGGEIKRTVMRGKKEVTSDKMITTERLAIIHFHPDVMSYILQENESRMNKVYKWRIPTELGKKLGMKDEDKCPTNDANDEPSYFAVPTYTVEEATADVEKAELEFKQHFKEFKASNERIATQDQSKCIAEIHDLKQMNELLIKENKELKERVRRETAKQNAMDRKRQRLQKGLEKLARRLDKWESTKKVGRTSSNSAKDIYKAATGQDLSEEGFFGTEPAGTQKYDKGRGGKRWSDPRMDRAVQARLDDPTLSAEDALRTGGYEFPVLADQKLTDKEVVDSDNVSIHQRKNNLLRRVRQKKQQMEKEANRGGGSGKETDDLEEEEREPEELETATVDDLVEPETVGQKKQYEC